MARTPVLLLAAAAVIAIVALVAMPVRQPAAVESVVRQPNTPTLQAGVAVTPSATLPDFSLRDQHRRPFTAAALNGHWNLVFPGFTHCPDICPTTLAILDRVHELLGSRASGLQVVLLSVDPQRDTPEELARYLEFFNPTFIGVTGEQEQLERLYTGLGVQHIRIPGARGEYSVDHSAALLLVDPEGKLAGYFMPPFNAERLAVDLEPLLAAGDA
ncbi:SCO family protein [Haliea sp. E1-2-M8]|uniref:SCO family protein n=1 Tax=Haliea sp. E1-2-M8 TaxID=3064706 RepID=UPI002727CF84|nr:SCO family protein [Haliea sp. E1-2-M8]MDO8860536.1 SCO family protein [Haliea sp. E1-2-M8]